jgi:hypothetical protein
VATAFLTSVKEEVTGLFAEAYDELSGEFGESVPEAVPTTLQKLQKKVWTLMEAKLKESFLNGKKAANGKPPERKPRSAPDTPPVSEPKGNPFRKT